MKFFLRSDQPLCAFATLRETFFATKTPGHVRLPGRFIGLWVLLFFLAALSSCTPDYYPKPRGYFRIDLPGKTYHRFDPADCPFSFDVPDYAVPARDSNRLAEPCWWYINFPRFSGSLYLSYKPVHDNVFDYIEDSYELVYKHTVKADEISEQRVATPRQVYGLLYTIGGNAASNLQFYVTDSTRHFLRGALYFNALPNSDSIAPVADFLKKDILRLIETLEWKPPS
jgi:gliding motility-associated lipoprotein GldD